MPNLQAGRWTRRSSGSRTKRLRQLESSIVDPRKTPTIAITEKAAGKDKVLHLEIEPGTDIALFNGLFTYVVEQGWINKEFIAKSTVGFDDAVKSNRISLDEGSITGIPVAKLRQAAEWAYKPKAPGLLPRTFHGYEKGIIWGNDNYVIQSALLDLVLATRNVGRRGTGCAAWVGIRRAIPGHRIRATRRSTSTRRSFRAGAGCNDVGINPFQTTLNAEEYRRSSCADPTSSTRRWPRHVARRPSRWWM